MRSIFVSCVWTIIYRLRGLIYLGMVRDFYVQMSFILENASSHSVTICDVQFEMSLDVIVQLLGMSGASESSTTKPIPTERAHDVDTSTSFTSLVDSHVERDYLDCDDASKDVKHDEHFFILTEKHRTTLDAKNTFTQKDLLHFFCKLHLIVATNLDSVVHKATFSQTCV